MDGRSARWNAHRATRRLELLDAGARALDTFGPDATASQIAEAAGVSKSVFYRYFADKQELQQAIAQRLLDLVAIAAVPSPDSVGTPRELIGRTTGAYARWASEHPGQHAFLRSTQPRWTSEGSAGVRLRQLLAGLAVRLGLDAQDAGLLAASIIGLVEQSVRWWLRNPAMACDDFVEHVCESQWAVYEAWLRRAGSGLTLDDPLPELV
jgi:AcrR family transcriptional regulator